MNTLFKKIKVENMTLGQASGSKAKVKYIGKMSCIIGNTHLQTNPKYSLGMPSNPTSTVSTYALKKFAGFVKASHDINEIFHVIDKEGIETRFTHQNGLLRSINGLDYIPIVHPVDIGPITNQSTIRRSKREPKPTAKMKQYLKNQQDSIENAKPILPLLSPQLKVKMKPKLKEQKASVEKTESIIALPLSEYNNDSTTHNNIRGEDDSSLLDIDVPPSCENENSLESKVQHNTLSLLTHLRFACRNNKAIRHMHNCGAMLGLPRVRELKYCCPICAIVKAPKI